MKVLKNIFYCFCLLAILSSCISDKKMIYLQGATDAYAVPKELEANFELKVEPDDQLAISITSKDPELVQRFNNNTLIGGGNNPAIGTNTVNVHGEHIRMKTFQMSVLNAFLHSRSLYLRSFATHGANLIALAGICIACLKFSRLSYSMSDD